MYSYSRAAWKRIHSRLDAALPGVIRHLYAFGSRVRGDFREDSDFDVLVVVDKKTIEVEKRAIDVFVDEEIESGISLDPVIKTAKSFSLEQIHNAPLLPEHRQRGCIDMTLSQDDKNVFDTLRKKMFEGST